MMAAETEIAGKKTVADWQKQKASLVVGGDPGPWKEAYEAFFRARLKTRYFAPIDVIKTIPTKNGEGFSIVAIQCSLIEFLGATLEGKSYKYSRNGKPKLGDWEYSDSKKMFVSFLRNQPPFKEMFSDEKTAEDFYASVRCGLLHEARTKGAWRIRVDGTVAIDTDQKVVDRNKLQTAFETFVAWYGEALPADKNLQEAFIRKFDSLCED